MASSEGAQPQLGTIEYQGRKFTVSVRVAFDGIEFVGRLWFAEEDWEDAGLPDRGAIPGRSRDEVISRARALTAKELELRHRRALAEKRRFVQLRHVTEDILEKIRYMNQIAISMRDGLLDEDGARQEIELTEKQLHECITRLRRSAGVES
ncbi:MAG TPA: hypothetical protein VH277_13820 [Gemmatimonadaceae bacterium]|jgi:hypothetical protein|nr:hypothetical protein [Gemmatimonadaceae bacterium]